MAVFRPKRPDFSPAAVSDFWLWWNGGGSTETANALERRDLGRVVKLLSKRISRISPGLDWETAPGTTAEHQLRVSGGGIPEFRPYAFRWKQFAPPPDATWEFAAGRPKFPVGALAGVDILGRSIDPNLARFALKPTPFVARVKLDVYHPDFDHLARGSAMHIAALVLDWTIGEDDVARYVSEFDVVRQSTVGLVDARTLLAAIDDIRITAGSQDFAQLRGELGGHPLIATVLTSARWVDFPLFDNHVEVKIRFTAARGPFPSEADVDRLQDLDESLCDALGSRAVKVAREYCGGFCTLHFYADSEDQNVISAFDDWIAGHPGWTISKTLDPSWSNVAYLIG